MMQPGRLYSRYVDKHLEVVVLSYEKENRVCVVTVAHADKFFDTVRIQQHYNPRTVENFADSEYEERPYNLFDATKLNDSQKEKIVAVVFQGALK